MTWRAASQRLVAFAAVGGLAVALTACGSSDACDGEGTEVELKPRQLSYSAGPPARCSKVDVTEVTAEPVPGAKVKSQFTLRGVTAVSADAASIRVLLSDDQREAVEAESIDNLTLLVVTQGGDSQTATGKLPQGPNDDKAPPPDPDTSPPTTATVQ